MTEAPEQDLSFREKPALIVVEQGVRDAFPAHTNAVRSLLKGQEREHETTKQLLAETPLSVNGVEIRVVTADQITATLNANPELRPAIVITESRERVRGAVPNAPANIEMHEKIVSCEGDITHVDIVGYARFDRLIDPNNAKMITEWRENGTVCVAKGALGSSPVMTSLRALLRDTE